MGTRLFGQRLLRLHRSSYRELRLTAAVFETLEPRKLLSSVSFSAVTGYPLNDPQGSGSAGGPTTFADFDDDTHEDAAAIVNEGVTVAYGNADGTFQPAVSLALTSNMEPSTFIATANVSGDGLDIVTGDSFNVETPVTESTNIYSNYIDVLVNSGNGSFTPEQVLFSAGSPYNNLAQSVTAGDLNGQTDLLVSSVSRNPTNEDRYSHVTLLLSNGKGGFTIDPIAPSSAPDTSYYVAVGDFNGDGNEDAAIANSASSTVNIFLGTGGGVNPTPKTVTLGFDDPAFMVSADLDGKANGGNPIDDLVVGGGDTLTIVMGNTSGTFTQTHTVTFGTSVTEATVADINGDHISDLVLDNGSQSGGGSHIATILGNNADSFSVSQNFAVSNSFTLLTVGNADSGSTFTSGPSEGDPIPDIVVAGQDQAVPNTHANLGYYGAGSVLLGNGDGTFNTTASQTFFDGASSDGIGPGTVNAMTVANVNGDGYPDILVADNQGVSVILGNGPGTFASQRTFATYSDGDSVAVGRFAAHGNEDIVVGGDDPEHEGGPFYGSSNVSVLAGDGHGGLGAPQNFNVDGGPETVALGDFKVSGPTDAKADIAAAEGMYIRLGYDAAVYTLVTASSGSSVSVSACNSSTISTCDDTTTNGIAVANFTNLDGDGYPDIVTTYQGDGSTPYGVAVLLNNANGAGTFNTPKTFSYGHGRPGAVVVGDFNGDGYEDFAVAYKTGVAVFLNKANGAGTFYPPHFTSTSSDTHSIAAGDFNNDGDLDLVVSYTSGAVDVLPGNGDGTFGSPVQITGAVTYGGLAVNDFTGDGNADVAYYDGFNVFVAVGNGDGTFQTPQEVATLSFEPRTDSFNSIAAGDFNNDGRPDIVVTGNAGDAEASHQAMVLLNNSAGSSGIDSWTGLGDGSSWSDPNNWWDDAVPTSSQKAFIPAGIPAVQVSGTYTVGAIHADSPIDITSGGSLTVDSASTLAALTINSGATATFEGTLSATGQLANAGTVNILNTSTIGQIIGNTGTLTIGTSTTPATLKLMFTPLTSPLVVNGLGPASTVAALNINTGSQLNISNHALVINYGSSGADPVTTMRADLMAAYAARYTGSDLPITSGAAKARPNSLAIGYADNTAGNFFTMALTVAGDATLDGRTNFNDLLVIAQHFGYTLAKDPTAISWANGDVNYDNNINFNDLLIVAQHFGETLTMAESNLPADGGDPVWYVDPTATGADNGSDWADAFTSLQTALSAAASYETSNPGTIIALDIAQGTYYPTTGTDRTATFQMQDFVSLYGGYEGLAGGNGNTNRNTSATSTWVTTLSGAISGSSSGYSHHVVNASGVTSGIVLDGLTITDGYANGSGADANGGGFYDSGTAANGGGPTLNNVAFTSNYADGSGGGVYVYDAAVTISNGAFSHDISASGGGVYIGDGSANLIGCTFTSDFAGSGGGICNDNSAVGVTSCAFSLNWAFYGGAVCNEGSSTISLCGDEFGDGAGTGDTGYYGGGAVYNSGATELVVACNFNGEQSDYSGGAMANIDCSPTIVDCVFENNKVTTTGDGPLGPCGGGAIFDNLGAKPTIVNCDFYNNNGNGSDTGGGILGDISSPATVANCIFWNDSGGEIVAANSGSVSTASYSDVQGGFSGAGNINSAPLFVSPGGSNIDGFELQANSPCINAGNNAAIPDGISTDDGGYSRIVDGTVDIGAFEYQ